MRRRSCWLTIIILSLLVAGIATVGVLLLGSPSTNAASDLNILEAAYLRLWIAGRETILNTPAGQDPNPVIFIVNPGDTAAVIGRSLAAQGLILDADLFRNYARYHGLDNQLEAGTYFLKTTQTIPEIALALTDSSAASVTVQILEGWRREEIAAAIDANPLLNFSGADFLAATGPGTFIPASFAAAAGLPEGVSLEGFLYPDTYFLPPDATATAFRDTLLQTFQERVSPLLPTAAVRLTLFEIVTLASIVEREAVVQEESSLIASVYLNRYALGMNLDADPTVQYGIGYRDGKWWPDITIEDYRTAQSPYNTYLHNGLPPGPIANPSLNTIRAVMNPATSDYYYFRADCAASGHHVFANTLEEHVANANCQ